MSKEIDCYATTVAVIKTWEAETWPTAFAAAPIVICFSTTNQKKSGAKNITSTGADISGEVTGLRILLVEDNGYFAGDANVPECDSGIEQITTGKIYQSASFGSTFSAAPTIVAGYQGTTVGGKKVSVTSITTTGFDVSGETTNDYTHWFAMIEGAFGF